MSKELTHNELKRWNKKDLVDRLWGEIQTNKELNSQLRAHLGLPSAIASDRKSGKRVEKTPSASPGEREPR